MNEAIIVSAARLAIGRLGGTLMSSDEVTMGATVVKAALERAKIAPEMVDEVILGQNYRTGKTASNIARPIAIQAGIPESVPQFTINKHCAAGLKSVMLAAQAVKAGDAEIVIAGGVELMSKAAYLVPDMRFGSKLGHYRLQDQLLVIDPLCGLSMGQTADLLAKRFNISREDQDRFALWSQEKAEKAIKLGVFREEIVPLEVSQKGKMIVFDTDEFPRFGSTLEGLAKLKPYFASDGTVTAGNASGMNDGAAAVSVMSAAKAKKMGIEPMGKIVSYASVGVDPMVMGISPVFATRLALKKANLSIEDIDLIEVNEAFACVCVYFMNEMKTNPNKVNVTGGAISLGHPIAATGAILLTKLLYELKRRNLRRGLVTMCIGGGQGVAMIVERF